MVEGAEASNHHHYPQREGSWSKGSGELGVIKDVLKVFPSTVARQDWASVPTRAPALGCGMGQADAVMYILFKHLLKLRPLACCRL